MDATGHKHHDAVVALGVVLEDYFQATTYARVIGRRQWPRFVVRVPEITARVLDELAVAGAQATFFADAFAAETQPALLVRIAAAGHEIACLLRPRWTGTRLDVAGTMTDAARTTRAILDAGVPPPIGARLAGPGSISASDLERLATALAATGIAYLSLRQPNMTAATGASAAPGSHLPIVSDSEPLLPMLGYFSALSAVRHAPDRLWADLQRRHLEPGKPQAIIINLWEIDPGQPRIMAVPMVRRAVHNHGLDRAKRRLDRLLADAPTRSMAATLGLPRVGPVSAGPPRSAPVPSVSGARLLGASIPGSRPAGPAVTLVIPMFNEAPALDYLMANLAAFATGAGRDLDLTYLFVDDASTDTTVPDLSKLIAGRADCRIVKHQTNRGVAAATMTGLAAAATDLVAVVDADCSYDPAIIASMVPLLTDTTALVTASPYHPQGRVVGVPRWRLGLSRGLSAIYGMLLAQRLHTYTACVRVYRRSAVSGLELRHGGFLGIAEIIMQLDARGQRIVECPAVLETRLFGQSKMKVAHTIAAHLGLIASLVVARVGRRRRKSIPLEPV